MRIKERTTPMGVALSLYSDRAHIQPLYRAYSVVSLGYRAMVRPDLYHPCCTHSRVLLLVVDYLEIDDFFSVVGQVGEYSHDLDKGEGVRGDFGGEVVLCRGGTDDGIDERVGGNVADCDLEKHREGEFGGGIGQKFGDNRGRNSRRIDHKRGFILRIKPADELLDSSLNQIGDIFAQFWLRK